MKRLRWLVVALLFTTSCQRELYSAGQAIDASSEAVSEKILIAKYPEMVSRNGKTLIIYHSNKIVKKIDPGSAKGSSCYFINVVNTRQASGLISAPVVKCSTGEITSYILIDSSGVAYYFDGQVSTSPDGKLVVVGFPGGKKYNFRDPSNLKIYAYPNKELAKFNEPCRATKWNDSNDFEVECFSSTQSSGVENRSVHFTNGKWELN